MNLNLIKVIRSRNFYLRLIISSLAISLIPVLIFGIVSYMGIKSTMENDINDTNIKYLKQTVNATEIVFNQIFDSSKQLGLSREYKDYVSYARRFYYEKLQGKLKEEDLNSLSIYLEYKSKLLEMIKVLELSNQFIDSVYFFDTKNNIILTNEMQYDFDTFYDKDLRQYMNYIPYSPLIIDNRTSIQKDRSKKNVITIVYKYTYDFLDNEGVLFINLDSEFLYDNIIKKLGNNVIDDFLILNDKNDLVIGRNDLNYIIKKFKIRDATMETSKSGNFMVYNNKTELFITFVSSEQLAWKFVTCTNLDNAYKSVLYIKLVIFITLLTLTILIVILSFISSRSLYDPIRTLLQKVKNYSYISTGYKENNKNSYSELNYIESSMEQAFKDQERLKISLKESLPAYKEKFLYSLVKGRLFDILEIEKKLNYFKLDICTQDLIVILLYIEELYSGNDPEMESINKECILETIIELMGKNGKVIAFEFEYGKFTIIYNAQETEISKVFSITNELKVNINSIFHLSCSISIGSHCKNISTINVSFKEAEEALKYRIAIGFEEIIYIEDIRLQPRKSIKYPTTKENTLNNYIKAGDSKNAKRVFSEILEDIAICNDKVNYVQSQQFFIGLLSKVLQTVDELGFELKDIFHKDLSLYNELIYIENINEIINWFNDKIEEITRYISNAKQQKDESHIEKILGILNSYYECDVSLTFIADKLKLSPGYVSRIFKQYTGKNFSNYLMEYKIKNAMELLTNTKLTVKEVSKKIGYNNLNYFISVFKEYTGTTPGEYKKINTDKNN